MNDANREITLRLNVQPAKAFLIEDTDSNYEVIHIAGSCNDALPHISEKLHEMVAEGRMPQRILSAYNSSELQAPGETTETEFIHCEVVWGAENDHLSDPMIEYMIPKDTLDEFGFSDPELTPGPSTITA